MKRVKIPTCFEDAIPNKDGYVSFDSSIYQDGGWYCSKCGTLLQGEGHSVGLADDDEGLHWRTFCDDCWNEIKRYSRKKIYNRYDESQPYPGR